jgi:hypothetical protein
MIQPVALSAFDGPAGQFQWGLSNGVTILGISGAFWFGLGLGPAAFAVGAVPWIIVLTIMAGGAAAFIRAGRQLRRRSGFRRSDLGRRDPATRRIIVGFRIVGLLQAVLVGLAVLLCVRFDRNDLIWPAIGVAVSVHFAPLAALFNVPAYYVTAAAGALVSTIALFAPLGLVRPLWLGAAMCAVMWSSALYLIRLGRLMGGTRPDVVAS